MKTQPRYKNFGERLRQLRQARGVGTQGELAQVLGVTQQTVSRWEAGTSRPRADEVPPIAAVLRSDSQQLLAVAGYAPDGVTVSFDRPLPLHALSADSFERFSLDFLATHFPFEKVHPAGKSGHKQFGIDIEVVFADSTIHTFQCKREKDFGAAKVRRAIAAHSAQAAKKFILLSRVASPRARAEVRTHADWDLWDQEDISRQFRSLPIVEQRRIVDIFFPGQRFPLLGESAPGPWLTVADFFAPQLVKGRVFNQGWELVGRARELDGLAHALGDSSAVAVSLIGVAGGGKSRVLRSALDAYTVARPDVLVRVVSPTEEVTAKSLEELGQGDKLLVVDDAHDRSDIGQLVRYAADTRSCARLLLAYRPYWTWAIERELGQLGLTGTLARSVTLEIPSKTDATLLAAQVLSAHGASTDAALTIADLAYDSPLAVVVGAQIVAKERVHPQLFGSNAEFRSVVLNHYEKVIAEDIAVGKDRERLHAMLRILALIQPVVPDDHPVLELFAAIERIDASDASRLARLLIDSGVLFKRGLKYRLSPDLLADSIIETACITSRGESNGYAERVFAAAIPEHKKHVLLNLGRLDWRRNDGDTSKSPLLDQLWTSLAWEDKSHHPQVDAAAAAAYFQPRQALTFAQRLVDQGHGKEEDVCRMIRAAAYNLDYLTDACALLWEAGQDDARPTNRHPNHPIRLLTDLAAPEPRKPIEHVEQVVDFALSLLDAPGNWTGAHTPLDVLRGALATEGQFTSAANSRAITISRYAVQRERVIDVRQRVISALCANVSHAHQRRAFLAAGLLGDALRGPMAPPAGTDDSWGDEFVDTLQRLDTLLDTRPIIAPVLVRIAESIHWHAFYGPPRTRPIAVRIIGRLDRDIETRTVRALIDAWGSNTWPIEKEAVGRPQHEADIDMLCRDLAGRYHVPEALAHFLNDRLNDIKSATGSPEYGPAQLFIGRLLSTNINLARYLVHARLSGEQTLLTTYGGRALGALITQAPDEACRHVADMLEHGATHLRLVAEGYMFATHPAPYSDIDVAALRRVFASQDGAVLVYASNIAREVARSDKQLAIDLLASVNVDLALRSTPDFFMLLAHDDTIPFALIRDDQLQRLIEGLLGAPDLDDYWLNAFLKKAIRRAPELVLDLAKARIDDALHSDDWSKRPLGGVFRDQSALVMLAQPEGPRLLMNLLDWSRERISDNLYAYHFAELVRVLCGPYDATCVAVLEDWARGGTAEHYTVLTAVLREAGQSFIYDHGPFIGRVLHTARILGRKVHKNLSSAIFASAVSGFRSGMPGKPFESDLLLKAYAERELAQLSRTDAAYDLYRGLREHAVREIERQQREGRLMDEEDEAA